MSNDTKITLLRRELRAAIELVEMSGGQRVADWYDVRLTGFLIAARTTMELTK